MRLLRPEFDKARHPLFSALAFSPDGRSLAAGFDWGGLHVWDLASDGPALRLGLNTYLRPQLVQFSPDSETVHWLSMRGREANDRATGDEVEHGPLVPRGTNWTAMTADGRTVFTLHGLNGEHELVAWREHDGAWLRAWTATPHDAQYQTFALDPSGKWLVNLAERRVPRTWPEYYRLAIRDACTGGEMSFGRYPYSNSSFTNASYCRLQFSPDGGTVVGFHTMTLLVWPVPKGGAPRLVRNDSRKHFTAAAFHPSGRYLLTTSNDETVVVWDAATWQPATRFQWQIGRLKAVAVSADGMLAAAGADDGTVIVWDMDL